MSEETKEQARQREYYEANRDVVTAKKRSRYAENKEEHQERDRKRYAENKEKIKARVRAYREANREEILKRRRLKRAAAPKKEKLVSGKKSSISTAGHNAVAVNSVHVECYDFNGEACLDYIDFYTDKPSRQIRLRPVWSNGQTVLREIKVYSFDRDVNGKSDVIQRVTGKNGPVPPVLHGIPSTKGGPKGEEK